jgi:hypothetical protein
MRVTLAAALAATIALTGAAAAQAPNALSPADQKAGWTSLFNGTSLDGWRAYKRPDSTGTRWVVKDALLCLDPGDKTDTRGARDIVFAKPYSQFELVWDWRVSAGGNSGLKYFVMEDRDAAIGHEYQLIDDAKHPDAKVGPHRQTAALYDVLPAADRPIKPAGEWNTSRVVVRGADVEHWLNGTKVLSYTLDSPALREAIAKSKFKDVERFGKPQDGLILLQDHGDAVCYRNVKVRPLNGAS